MEVKEKRVTIGDDLEDLEAEIRKFLQEISDMYAVSKRINSSVKFEPMLFMMWRNGNNK